MADSARQRPSRCNLVPMMKLFIAVLIGPTHLCTASERPRVRLVVKDLVDASAGTGSGCIAPASLCRIAALPVGGYLTSTFGRGAAKMSDSPSAAPLAFVFTMSGKKKNISDAVVMPK